jgi:DNA polymerase elongation subunit (family B)
LISFNKLFYELIDLLKQEINMESNIKELNDIIKMIKKCTLNIANRVKMTKPQNDTHLNKKICEIIDKIVIYGKQIKEFECSDFIDSITQKRAKDLYGFKGDDLDTFLEVKCNSKQSMYKIIKLFESKQSLGLDNKQAYIVYESNISPILRFIHTNNLQSCGWINIKKYNESKILLTKCDINIDVSYENIVAIQNNTHAPFKIMSFDIECTSSHGDFPVPLKDYTKTCKELILLYNKLIESQETNIKEELYKNIISIFDNTKKGFLSKVFVKDNIKPNMKRIKEIIVSIYDILDGKIIFKDVFKNKFDKELLNNKNTKSNTENNVNDVDADVDVDVEEDDENDENDDNEQKDQTVDNKIKQLRYILNTTLPRLEGDAVIQIGLVIEQQNKSLIKEIITLDTCDKIDDSNVYECETEKQLMFKFIELINKHDPDIITGYNILGFDFKYIYNRCRALNIVSELMDINRFDIKGMEKFNREYYQSKWKCQKLVSSALGDNHLYYIEMTGRVIIDVMKVVQRDYKLDSYKLDAVAQTFMSGKIKEITMIGDNKLELKLDSTMGLRGDGYIKIGENNKMEIRKLNIEKNIVEIDRPDDFLKMERIWSLSKDDIEPKEIFAFQKESSYKRSIIAKYCIQDCVLCNYILKKLEILIKNFGMANVCNVPLSYIFFRGQGIKVLSLVAKECKNSNVIIPVKKFMKFDSDLNMFDNDNKIYDEDFIENTNVIDDTGYEGAIVLTPKPGIYIDNPIAILDYASLYPSCMISENISHDSYIDNPVYDNLPNYTYIDVEYIAKDKYGNETTEKNRYAQFPDGKKGIIPTTLQKLLCARKNTKKQMEEKTITLMDNTILKGLYDNDTLIELDPLCDNSKDRYFNEIKITKENIKNIKDTYNEFEKGVLDGLQLAYKITANSVYGQVGASTSAIYWKHLAASTTATGRKHILMAKKFVEKSYEGEVIYGLMRFAHLASLGSPEALCACRLACS